MSIELGDRGKDKMTGYTGIVTCLSEWLWGCRRVQLTPEKLTESGMVPDGEFFDIMRVVVLEKGVFKKEYDVIESPEREPVKQRRGGPQSDDRMHRKAR